MPLNLVAPSGFLKPVFYNPSLPRRRQAIMASHREGCNQKSGFLK
jgi:hypothetical protein